MNHPTKTKELATAQVPLNAANKFQGLGTLVIPTGDFKKDPTLKQYVYLLAHFPDRVLEKVVMVTFQSGYIFIQTDKTIYTPNTVVNYRMFAVTPGMKPVERDEVAQNDASITIEMETPEGVVLPLDTVSLKSGMYSGDYKLGEVVSPGLWKVVSRFHSNPQQPFISEFEVKEYVLPSFEVKLTPQTAFFYLDSELLIVDIKATYLFGQNVHGVAYVVFGVVYQDQRRSFTNSLQRVNIRGGVGAATLRRQHITQSFNINELVKSSIFVTVNVMTDSGSEMVEADLKGIQIVTSPYSITFTKTPNYFKPGMFFDLTVQVENPDGSPAKGIPVVVGPGDVSGRTGDNGVAKLTINPQAGIQKLVVTAVTRDREILENRQARAEMTVLPYQSGSNNYLHISVVQSDLKLGDNMKININLNKQNQNRDLTYLILSRGQLMKFGRYETQGRGVIALSEIITKDFLPSIRIVAYYHVQSNEVVSDSVWVDIADSCMGSLTLESTRQAPSYEPRRMFGIKITGDPGALVGMVAVDKGVYVLNNKHRLTQKKVWDVVEKYDTGCTAGGGKNSMGVFFDAGLLFETNLANIGTVYRQEQKCPVKARKKRATTILQVRTTLASRYSDEVQRKCCIDGMTIIPLSYSCDRRAEYITDGSACVEAFLFCCKELATQQAEFKHDSLILARSEEDDKSYMDTNEIVSRTKFPESWLFTEIPLPECPPHSRNCATTSVVKNIPLQDSITTWKMTGISLSRTLGICIDDSLEVVVRKDFFIDLRLPYSAVRGEQLEVKAILHNYTPDRLTVRVDLIEAAGVCSSAYKRGRYRQEVIVGSYTTRSVSYIIIPMEHGKHPIEVKAAVKDSSLNDGIKKFLLVVPAGVLVKAPKNVTLEPAKHNGEQVEVINSQIPKSNIVPGTPSITQVSVTGGQQMSMLVENAISGNSMGSLIYQPSGCGEQNMIHMTLPVIATIYLDRTNQWEIVGFGKRKEALQHIMTGYRNELAYRKKDGSFAVWAANKSSSWLTAYVIKVFSMASQLVAIDKKHICEGVKWLILNAQQPDGIFIEVGSMYHGEMMGDVRGRDSDASMTAFVLIALQESQQLCANSVPSMPGSIANAVAHLQTRLPNLANPYAVAMVSYALANENKLNRERLFQAASSELDHWTVPGGHLYTLEATAYALLALVKVKAFEEAGTIVKWLNKQRKVGGGYGSTQATIIVYQAVSEYWVNAKETQYDMSVDIKMPGRAKPDRYSFNRETFYQTRSSKINEINQDVQVVAKGAGEATLTMVSLYYSLPVVKESDCNKFSLTVELIPEKLRENGSIYKLKIEILYLDKTKDATMSILDIGLLTGFTADTNDLKLLANGKDRTISKYEMDNILSDKGSLIIYLDKVSHKRPDEIAFRITQKIRVGVLQPAAVSVYEYLDQRQCIKFYHPERSGGQLLRLCQNEVCTCAEENCSMQKKEKINNSDRNAKACEVKQHSNIDYVYKVRMETWEDAVATDIYTMRVEDVIKEGAFDIGAMDQTRLFLSYSHCREALDLKQGNAYLIMGTSKDVNKDEQSEKFTYILGENTWIEYWPADAECQSDEHRPTCVGIEELVQQYRLFGCQQ
ncbi:complement C3-like isoform X2 [Lampris incognitus]|nr:complement C3-like isoform X2 [Lampris incognitus]